MLAKMNKTEDKVKSFIAFFERPALTFYATHTQIILQPPNGKI